MKEVSLAVLSALGAWIIYTCYVIHHRLFLSAISKFPGPKLAAATFWYEFYYDIVLGGKYIWKIKALHEQYGPIIRINPDELHVSDPTFWDVIYTASTNSNRRDKLDWQTKGSGIPKSILGTAPHALHRLRRSAINPFFSMQNVRKLVPGIQERVDALVDQLKARGSHKEVVNMAYAFSAFTNDVVMQYSFGRNDHHIEAPDFDPKYHNISFSAANGILLLRHFNWILDIMTSLPESIAVKLGDEVAANIVLINERIKQVEDIRREGADKAEEDAKTIFHQLLQSDLPPTEKETKRLAEEAVLLVGAGTHTTSWILTVLSYYLLANHHLLRRLKAELSSAGDHAPLPVLEKLPFLNAVLKEGLRLAYGSSARSARIAPDVSLQCGSFTIPPGTPVSMTVPITHHDPSIFANPDAFEPDRWMDPSTAAGLDRFLVPFSKGSRNCLGMNLAWAEIYMCAAAVFGRFGSGDARDEGDVGVMELYETDEGDVKMESDMFFPVPRKGSKGVRVRISSY